MHHGIQFCREVLGWIIAAHGQNELKRSGDSAGRDSVGGSRRKIGTVCPWGVLLENTSGGYGVKAKANREGEGRRWEGTGLQVRRERERETWKEGQVIGRLLRVAVANSDIVDASST